MIKEGVFLGKRYEILGRIGSGGMADVYKGKDHKLNRFVAIKVLKSTYRSDETFIKKFLSEAQAAAGLMHPNVVNVYDVGQDRGLYYMVMELVEGITLKDYIEKKGKLSAKETISISIQMVTGIQAAHNCHIIHRDIKPQNIIISKDGKVKVTDFGIARATTSTATQAVTTTVMGSVHYTSPEQARGGIVDEKSDIYSAGITMYEMITGHVPFDGDSTVTVALKHLNEVIKSPAEEVPDIPYSLECIIMKCTQKLPNKRYMSCEELLQDLKHSLVDPEGDFVVLDGVTKRMPATSQDTGRTTVVMSPDELNRMKNRQNYNDDYDDDYEEEDSYYDRQRPARRTERRNSRRRPDSSSEELAAPIRNIARTGSTAAEKLTTFILRPAPVLMSAIILAITFFSFWNQLSDYGDINTLTSNPDLTLIAYLAVGAVMLIWMLSTFFFTLSGIRHGTGRGLTYFVLVYVLSYLFSLAAAAIPADVQLLTGIRGGILVFGSLYPAYFPFCVVGIITCILRKILK